MTARDDPERAPTRSRHPVGSVVVSRHPVTSRAERELGDRLRAAGIALHPGRSAIQCGVDDDSGGQPVLTPDFVVRDSRVCVEFDPEFTHRGRGVEDLHRDRLLAEVGWTVVRLRTGGLTALGPYDVTTESASFTTASVEALVDSIADAVAGRPGVVRHVTRAPASPRAKSRLGSIARDRHLENAFYASWILDSGEVARLRIMAGGHFLAAHGAGWGVPAFIVRLGLDRVPRGSWRSRLEAVLEMLPEASLAPTSRFPWGDDLFVGDYEGEVAVDKKFNVGASAHIGSLALPDAAHWSATSIVPADGSRLDLHPEAIDAGWRFTDVRNHSGPTGAHQAYLLTRDGERRGLWAAGPERGTGSTSHASLDVD